MRVLITGASGLLGSRLLHAFPDDWEVAGTCHSRPVPGLIQCSLSGRDAVADVVRKGRYDWVVHCAAIRSPDICDRDPQRAMAVNAEGARQVAAAAAASGARIAYASTDYVFPGATPPYTERDAPAPLNVYGQSKRAGEHHVLSVPRALVVRMPALYSLDLEAPNNLLGVTRASLERGKPVAADNHCVRYYTLAEEVAAAFVFLMRGSQTGVVHVSAPEACTKLHFLREAATAMGLSPGLVVEGEAGPKAAARPLDSHLDTARLAALGGPAFTGYSLALERLAARRGGARS
jgi:dTDP-4-dehydrorhamnose reductase